MARYFHDDAARLRVGLGSVSRGCGDANDVISGSKHQHSACGFDSLHRPTRSGGRWERKQFQPLAVGQFVDVELLDAVLRLFLGAGMSFGEVVIQIHDEGMRVWRLRRPAP